VPQLWLKARDSDRPSRLAGTEGAQSATFAPNGQWIAFGAFGTLRKIQVGGGAAITLADTMGASIAPAWLDDGTIVFVGPGTYGLRRVADGGGSAPTVIWPRDSGAVRGISALPGARGVLVVRCSAAGCASRDLWAIDLRSGAARMVVAGALAGSYLATGHVLYVRADGAALVIPFDLGALEPHGSPVAVLDSVLIDQSATVMLGVSASGTLVMIRGAAGLEQVHNLVWVDRAGRTEAVDMGGPLRLTPQGNAGWALSPDGRRLAIGLNDASGGSIYVKVLPDGPLSRVTFDSAAAAMRPRWLPGARALSFVAASAASLDLRRVAADGTTGASVLARLPGQNLFEGAESPDGQWIVARTAGGLGRQGRDIVGWRTGDSTVVPLIANPAFDESAFAISPDGRWIAYESDETGRREVYVRPFPHTDAGRWQASTAGGMAPLWARNGRELFFVDAQRRMTAVTVAGGTEPHFGERRTLFTLSPDDDLDDNTSYPPFDIAPDGRFIMARRERTSAAAPPLIVVENWFTELRQKLQQH